MQNSTKKCKIIAVDGEPAAGKGTLAKAIAKHYHMLYMDTGAMFRAIGLYFFKQQIEMNDMTIASHLVDIDIDFRCNQQENEVFLNGKNVTKEIRTNEVSMYAKEVSKNSSVRKKLIELQRKIAKDKDIVVDGQDIGTVVFPEADVKIFLVASLEQRAKRRKYDFEQKKEEITFEQVKQDLKKRTEDDYTRKEAPLKKAKDAIVIDNSQLTKEETLQEAIKIIEKGW